MRAFSLMVLTGLLLGLSAAVLATTIGDTVQPSPPQGTGDGGYPDPTALHSVDAGTSVLGGVFSTRTETIKTLTTWDTAAGANMTATETGLNRQTAQLTVSASPLAVDGGMTVSGTLGVTGATTAAAVATTGRISNTLVGTAGSGYTDSAMCTGASIYQSQAATGNYVMSLCANDSSNNWVGFAPSGGGTASGAVYFRSGSANGQLYMGATGYKFDSGGSGTLTLSTTLAAFPALVSTTGINITGTCTGTVATNAVTCSGSSGVITDDGTDINLSSTRADITWTNTKIASTSVVLLSNCSKPDSGARINSSVVPGSGTATLTIWNDGLSNQTSVEKICFFVTN